MRPYLLFSLLALLVAPGCVDDDLPPPAPGVGGRPPPTVTGGRDAAVEDAEPGDAGVPTEDGGATGLPWGCAAIPAGDTANRATLTGLDGFPVPFAPTRAYAVWNPLRCTDTPEIVVGLSEGICATGVGRRLVLVMDASEIGGGLLSEGVPISVTGLSAMTVLYVEPATADTPAGIWGNCYEATGVVRFEQIDTLVGSRIQGTVDAILDDCDDLGLAPIDVQATFDVTLETTWEGTCIP